MVVGYYRGSNKWTPATVEKRTYEVRTENTMILVMGRRHIDQVRVVQPASNDTIMQTEMNTSGMTAAAVAEERLVDAPSIVPRSVEAGGDTNSNLSETETIVKESESTGLTNNETV